MEVFIVVLERDTIVIVLDFYSEIFKNASWLGVHELFRTGNVQSVFFLCVMTTLFEKDRDKNSFESFKNKVYSSLMDSLS